MVFYKNIEVRDIKSKYEGAQRGLFARERINPGELIWHCNCGAEDGVFTRVQLLDIIRKHPHLDYFVRSFSYMVDDDLYLMPHTYMEQKNNDECALFNHSCNPNCGFDETGDGIIAIRTIEPGDELAYHYGFLETEMSLIYGMNCKCGSSKCDGKLLFDYYRDPDFIEKYFPCMTPYLQKKAVDMKERWYSSNCYVKRFENEREPDVEKWDIGLFSISTVKKEELVASFSNDEIAESKQFLRHSAQPNCYIDGRDVFARDDIPSDTELTLYYHGILL